MTLTWVIPISILVIKSLCSLTENVLSFVQRFCTSPALLLVSFTLMIAILVPMTHVQHWLLWCRRASLLPEPVTPFVGREKEQSELTKWLDLHSDEVRIINIVGPTGIGKSALAIQLGHQLIDKGAIVSYVDTSLIFLEGISSEILRSTGSTIASKSDNSSTMLINWLRREMNDPLVVILDNLDRYLAGEMTAWLQFFDQLYSNAATIVKIIITSRKAVKLLEPYSENFIVYPIEEIYPDASCQILCAVSKREMSAGVCESIIELTGNIPLSLTLIGTTLELTPVETLKVVSFFEKETKLAPAYEKQLHASISVTLIYLRNKLINLGKYLSLFPASFSLTDACSVLHSIVNDDCVWIDKLHQKNLLFLTDETHYHFRDVVREHFIKHQGNNRVNQAEFWHQYMQYFTALLHKQCLEFQYHPNSALELEKQEMRHFIRSSIDHCGEYHYQCCQLLQVLKVSVDTRFIFSIYGNESLTELLHSILTTIELVFNDNTTFSCTDAADDLYIYFTLILVDLNDTSQSELVFEQAQHWVDDHSDDANSTLVEQFYLKLSAHYLSKGKAENEIYSHLKILKRLGSRALDCNSSNCTYSDISDAYYSLGRYELSGYFQKLYIGNSNLSKVQMVEALLRLHTCQVGNLSEARDTAKKILDLSIDKEMMDVCNRIELYLNISNVFRHHEWREEAKRVEQKILTTAKKQSHFKSAENKVVRQLLFSLIDTLVKAKEHLRIPEVVECALNTYEDENYNSREVAGLYLVLGKAELYNHRRRASIDNLKVVMQWYYKDTTLFNYARDACNAMLIQTHIESACFMIAMEETGILINSIWSFILSDMIDPEQFSISHIFDSPTNILLADKVEDIPVVHYCIVFFFKWCLANVRFLFSYRFLVILVNFAFILFKFACVVSAPTFSFFLIYGFFSYVKRFCRMLWDPLWSDD